MAKNLNKNSLINTEYEIRVDNGLNESSAINRIGFAQSSSIKQLTGDGQDTDILIKLINDPNQNQSLTYLCDSQFV